MTLQRALWLATAIYAAAMFLEVGQARAADLKPCQPDQLATRYPGLVGKTIRVGQDGVSMPFSFHDPESPDRLIGADTDYARAVFACLGVPVTFEVGTWSGLLPAVAAARIDVMWDVLYYTPERAQKVDFVIYSAASDTVVLQKGNPRNIQSMADLCGARALAGLGTVEALLLSNLAQKCTAEGKPPIQINTYQDRSTAWQMIQTKRADIVLSATAMGAAAVAARPNDLESGFSFLPDVRIGTAVAKGNAELEHAIADAMGAVMASGQAAKIYASYKLNPKLLLTPEILTK